LLFLLKLLSSLEDNTGRLFLSLIRRLFDAAPTLLPDVFLMWYYKPASGERK
jgi:hypothetical protein